MSLPSKDQLTSASSAIKRRLSEAFARGVSRAGTLDGRMLAWGGIALAALMLLSVNVIAGTWFKTWRADLTEDGLYSISNGTKKILADLDEPITVRVYYSPQIGQQAPSYGTYFERVRTLLERYRDLSRGKLQLAFITPQPFSDEEDRAVASGLRGVRLNNEGDTAYFGLVASNTTDNTDTIPFFAQDRERFVEYDLTKLIYGLSNPKKKTIGLISGLPIEGGTHPMMMGRQMPPWTIVSQMREFFDVKSLAQNIKEVPADIDVLMLVQPWGLTPEAAYAVDQFALKGGRILAFVDPVAEVGRMFAMRIDAGDGKEFQKLLGAWGVSFDATKVASDIAHARRVQFGGGARPTVTEYVAWLGLDRRNLDESDPLAAGIETLNVATPGFLSPTDKATTSFRPILKTSTRASVLDSSAFGASPDPVALLRSYKPGGKQLVLAARVSGEIATAFPEGAPKPAEKKDEAAAKADQQKGAAEQQKGAGGKQAARAKQTKAAGAEQGQKAEPAAPAQPSSIAKGTLNAIIVADTDMLHDQFWVDTRELLGQQIMIPTAHNAVFVVNALENLTGGEALSDLRGRGVKPRPFQVVEEIRRDAERRFREKEQTLLAKLKDTEQKLQGLEKRTDGGTVILSDKDRETIETFRSEMLGIRRELRDVKLAMRQDIDRLEGAVKVANIAAVPLLIAFGAIGLTIVRRRRRSMGSKGQGGRA